MPRKSTPTITPQPQLITFTAPIPKRALTVPEAAELLSIGLNSMYSLIREGQLKVVRVGAKGRGIVVPVAEIDAYLARETGKGA